MEEEIRSLESETGFRVLFEYATIGILVVGADGRIELANPHALELFGYGQAELIGQAIEILIPDALRHKHKQHREGYFAKPKVRPMGLGIELFAKRKDGTIFPVEISLGHYLFSGEKMAVAFITDITARSLAEKNLKKVNEDLEAIVRERTLELTNALEHQRELGELKSRFVSFASHEFRTPLSTILSSISLVDRYVDAGNKVMRKKHVDRIKSSVRNLTFILNDFLSLDKLEEGKVEIENMSFNVKEFFNDMMEEMDGVIKNNQHIIFSHSGNKTINQDKKILRNVMLNLLSNASKYSAEGMDILLNVAIKNNQVTIKVSDKGIGIPENEQSLLFRKFFRAANAINIQGTGLGLNIVKRYLDLMKGSIDIKSKLHEGTTVTLKFPSNER